MNKVYTISPYGNMKYRQYRRYHVFFVRKCKTFQKINIPRARFNSSGTSLFNNFKNARVESATAWERDKSRYLALALLRSKASRFLKGLNFRHVWSFHVKTSRILVHHLLSSA